MDEITEACRQYAEILGKGKVELLDSKRAPNVWPRFAHDILTKTEFDAFEGPATERVAGLFRRWMDGQKPANTLWLHAEEYAMDFGDSTIAQAGAISGTTGESATFVHLVCFRKGREHAQERAAAGYARLRKLALGPARKLKEMEF